MCAFEWPSTEEEGKKKEKKLGGGQKVGGGLMARRGVYVCVCGQKPTRKVGGRSVTFALR